MKKRLIIVVILLAMIAGIIVNNLLEDNKEGKSQICFGTYCFEVEIAQTSQEKAQGLMYKQNLDQDKGMLFIYNDYGEHNFWMKNTLIPLDIIWIKDNEVVYIFENAQPCEDDCNTINSEADANYVLEINAGLVDKYDIKIGDNAHIIDDN